VAVKIFCGMATRPSREKTAPKVVREILPQVDVLYLHLDGFQQIPQWARDTKIVATLFPEGSPIGAAGKLDAHEYASKEDIVLVVDDDVKLPRNLGKVIRRAIAERLHPTLFGLHGARLLPPVESYLKDRAVIQLGGALPQNEIVDVVATCVAAYSKADFTPMRSSWTVRNAVDLQLSLDAESQGVQRVLLARRKNWASFRDVFQTDSIYRRLVEDDRRQTKLAQELFELSKGLGHHSE
jgi:hypothetical protein